MTTQASNQEQQAPIEETNNGATTKNEVEEDEGDLRNCIKRMKKKFIPGLKYTLLFSLVINIAMLVIGCINAHRCPANKNIPLFLVGTGIVGLFSKFTTYIKDRLVKHFQVKYIESALYTIELVFFIMGTYWTYKIFKPSFDVNDGDLYCNKTAYMFSFIYITAFYALLIAFIVFGCCFIICFCLLASSDDKPDPESQIPYIDATPSNDR